MAAVEKKTVSSVDQRLPLLLLLAYGLQHVMAMYSGAVAVPLIVAAALDLPREQLIFLINADLFTCGVATLVQTLGLGSRIGARLPLMQGCTFAAVTPMIMIGQTHGGGMEGLRVVYGSVIAAGLFSFLIAKYFSRMLDFFPKLVTGTVIIIIGISLMPVAVQWAGGGDPAAIDYCAPHHISMAAAVLAVILFFYRVGHGFVRNVAVLLGLILGTLAATLLGAVDYTAVAEAPLFDVTLPFAFGPPIFDLSSVLSMTLVMLIVMAETTGDVVAVSEIVGHPMSQELLARTLRADGITSILGGILNAFPYTAFSQNVGLLSLTRIKSRYVVAVGGGLLMLMGLLPKLAAVIACVPTAVLGGAGLAMFGMVAANGVKTLSRIEFDKGYNMMVVAIGLSVALVPPGFYHKFPVWAQLVLNSGITMGSLATVVLNLLLNGWGSCRNKTE